MTWAVAAEIVAVMAEDVAVAVATAEVVACGGQGPYLSNEKLVAVAVIVAALIALRSFAATDIMTIDGLPRSWAQQPTLWLWQLQPRPWQPRLRPRWMRSWLRLHRPWLRWPRS